jgi:hypothetical protein
MPEISKPKPKINPLANVVNKLATEGADEAARFEFKLFIFIP